jgi:hypothetical protein
MAIDYTTLLTTEQKREILAQRMTQFAAEAYQHSLNKATCEALNDAEGVEAANKATATLEAAINVHAAELSALGDAE